MSIGTRTRQRSNSAATSAFLLRMTPEQHAELARMAEDAGLTIRAYALRALLNHDPHELPRSGRPNDRAHRTDDRPSVEHTNGHVQEALLPDSA